VPRLALSAAGALDGTLACGSAICKPGESVGIAIAREAEHASEGFVDYFCEQVGTASAPAAEKAGPGTLACE
jgi:hypothetical protein